MAEFPPVETVADFKTLDDGDILEGYLDGVSGAATPGSGHSRAYWHGWRNGMIETDRHPVDLAYLRLAQSFEQTFVTRH